MKNGQKWQCVEFIKRFYYEDKGHKIPDIYGHAKDFFDYNVLQGEVNKHMGLVQYRNGCNVKPKPDDLIVFADTKFGHAAIVTEVSSDYIEVIQQNIHGKTRENISLLIKRVNILLVLKENLLDGYVIEVIKIVLF